MQAVLDGFGIGAKGAMVQRGIGRCEEEVGVSNWTSKGTCRTLYANVSHIRLVRSLNEWIHENMAASISSEPNEMQQSMSLTLRAIWQSGLATLIM